MNEIPTFEAAKSLCMPSFAQTSRVRQAYVNDIILERKKEIILFESPENSMVMIRLRKRVASVLAMMTPVVPPDVYHVETWEDLGLPNHCWFNHRLEGDGSLSIAAYIDSSSGRWTMNFGIANLLVRGLLTDEEKRGLIKEKYDLSHLCGNWRCMNHYHHIVESKVVNLQRKACFAHVETPCTHDPPCGVYNQEYDGNHNSPNAKRFRKNPLWRDLPIEPEEDIPALELDELEETDKSTELQTTADDLDIDAEDLKQVSQEPDLATACRLVLSDTDMVMEQLVESGLVLQQVNCHD